jgi:hypothetical protein
VQALPRRRSRRAGASPGGGRYGRRTGDGWRTGGRVGRAAAARRGGRDHDSGHRDQRPGVPATPLPPVTPRRLAAAGPATCRGHLSPRHAHPMMP